MSVDYVVGTPLKLLPAPWQAAVARDFPIDISVAEMATLCPSTRLPDIMHAADAIVFHKLGLPWDEIRVHPYFVVRNASIFTCGSPLGPHRGQLYWKGCPVVRDTSVIDGVIGFYRLGEPLVYVQEATS